MDKTLPVLIVEDSRATAFVVRRVLRACGFSQIDFALDGVMALSRMRRGNFGLVMADVHMQPMNGLALLQHVRADPQLRDTCFVLMSALKESDAVVAARECDVDSFMLKPFDAKRLTEKLRPLRRLRNKFSVMVG